MIAWLKNKTVYVQILFLTVFSLLSLLLVFGYFADSMMTSYSEYEKEYLDDITEQMKLTVTSNYNSISQIIRLISYNGNVQNYLLAADAADRFEGYSLLQGDLSDISILNSQILDIVIVNTRDEAVNLSDNLYAIPEMDLSDGRMHVSSQQFSYNGVRNTKYLAAGKQIYSIDSHNQTSQCIGTVYMILQSSVFTGGKERLEGNDQLFFLDNAGNVLWGASTSAETGMSLPGMEPVREVTVSPLDFHILVYRKNAHLPSWTGDWQLRFSLLMLGLCVFILFLWILFAHNTAKPYKVLNAFFSDAEEEGLNQLENSVRLEGSKEARQVGRSVNQMLSRINFLTKELVQSHARAYKNELLARQSELQYLRSEINPHFLYNTLETMVGIAYSNGQKQIAGLARSLSIIFKYSIKGKEFVPLRDELKVASNYLSIQEYRFSGRFEVAYRIDEDCKELLVPKMILQPLIENAIVHGVEGQDRYCHVSLCAGQTDGILELAVSDDGAGISQELLERLRLLLDSQARSRSGTDQQEPVLSIGLKNVNDRIKLTFGTEYGVFLTSETGKGTRAVLRLPVKKER